MDSREASHSNRCSSGKDATTRPRGIVADERTDRGTVMRQEWVRMSKRVSLHPGDKVRVSGGPYWEQIGMDGSITKTRMAERGVMVFEEYCQLGQRRWVVARGRNGYAALHIGPQEQSCDVPGLVRRPYRLRRIRPAKAHRKVAPARDSARVKPSARRRHARRRGAR